MDIYLSAERAYQLIPQFSVEVARDRVERKKMSLVAGTVGALFSRPKPEEIQLISVESRLEPFWVAVASSRTVYNRANTYTVTVSGADVKSVTMLGQEVIPAIQPKGAPTLSFEAVEHCLQELHVQQTFDGISGVKTDLQKYINATKVDINDVDAFVSALGSEGILLVPPQVRATAIVRQVTAEVVPTVQNAQVLLEERVDIEVIELNFRPVYAFEYEWAAKDKKVVVEFDAVEGEIQTGGKKWGDQIKGVMTKEFLFDITADAIKIMLPGRNIAMKFIKSVTDRGK